MILKLFFNFAEKYKFLHLNKLSKKQNFSFRKKSLGKPQAPCYLMHQIIENFNRAFMNIYNINITIIWNSIITVLIILYGSFRLHNAYYFDSKNHFQKKIFYRVILLVIRRECRILFCWHYKLYYSKSVWKKTIWIVSNWKLVCERLKSTKPQYIFFLHFFGYLQFTIVC